MTITRTGVHLNSKLFDQIKIMALDQRITIRAVIEKALKQYVKEHIESVSDNFSGHGCFEDFNEYD